MAVERKDIASVGRAMYRELRSELEANHWGRMVVIDVNTGDYEVGDDDLTATLRLRGRYRVPSLGGESRLSTSEPRFHADRAENELAGAPQRACFRAGLAVHPYVLGIAVPSTWMCPGGVQTLPKARLSTGEKHSPECSRP